MSPKYRIREKVLRFSLNCIGTKEWNKLRSSFVCRPRGHFGKWSLFHIFHRIERRSREYLAIVAWKRHHWGRKRTGRGHLSYLFDATLFVLKENKQYGSSWVRTLQQSRLKSSHVEVIDENDFFYLEFVSERLPIVNEKERIYWRRPRFYVEIANLKTNSLLLQSYIIS